MQQSLVFKGRIIMRIISAAIPSYIANVHNYFDAPVSLRENTGYLRVSKDQGVTWRNIQLTDGNYTVDQIQNAINASIVDWLTNQADSCFSLRVNGPLAKCYVEIDSTKLAAGTGFYIDFAPTDGNGIVSSLAYLLGFTSPSLLNSDGLHPANDIANIDYYGNFCSIQAQGFGYTSIVNEKSTYEIAQVDLTNVRGNVILYPSDGITTPGIPVNPPSIFNNYSFSFYGTNGKPVLFTQGECSIVFQLIQV